MVPQVRVYLITFHRPELLPRAVESLRRQTFTNWVCEVQNGDPADAFPARFFAELGDARFTLRVPDHLIGPVEAFNLAHQPAPEPYQSLLEDDNWWEPDFLATMVAEIERHPDVDLAWANMRLWQELEGNHWQATGQCVWAPEHWTEPRLFSWPQLLQFGDILYSNGAMLLRSAAAARLLMPANTPRDMIEHTRERLMRYPILFVPRPLANFALTLRTFRTQNLVGWGQSQALLGAAFLRQVPLTAIACRQLWADRSSAYPPSTNSLFFAALLAHQWSFLRHARPRDWLNFLLGCLRHPRVSFAILRVKQRQAEFWPYLNRITAECTAAATANGFSALAGDTVVNKQRPPPR